MIALNSVDLPLPLTPTSAVIVPRRDGEAGVAERRVAVAVGDGDVVDGDAGGRGRRRRRVMRRGDGAFIRRAPWRWSRR